MCPRSNSRPWRDVLWNPSDRAPGQDQLNTIFTAAVFNSPARLDAQPVSIGVSRRFPHSAHEPSYTLTRGYPKSSLSTNQAMLARFPIVQ